MSSPDSRARDIAEQLSAATGRQARTIVTPHVIRVEIDVPADLTPDMVTAVVTALATADRYGHDQTAHSAVAWAELLRLP